MTHSTRITDPTTRHDAAVHAVTRGVQADQQALALRAVRMAPGLTSGELAQHTPLDRYMLARRLPELENDGWVWRGPKKPCPVSGRSGCTWWPTPAPPEVSS